MATPTAPSATRLSRVNSTHLVTRRARDGRFGPPVPAVRVAVPGPLLRIGPPTPPVPAAGPPAPDSPRARRAGPLSGVEALTTHQYAGSRAACPNRGRVTRCIDPIYLCYGS